MASPNIDSLFPLILPSLPECPFDSVRLAVRRAARDFCRHSTAWRELLAPIPLFPGLASYTLILPADSELYMVANVYGPYGELTGKSLDQLRLDLPEWLDAVGVPRFFNTNDLTALTVYPTPAPDLTAMSLLPRLVLLPRLDCIDLPALLTTHYEEALVAGALARLYAMDGRPWAQPAQAPRELATFDRLAVAARIAMLHGQASTSIRIKPRSFGA